MNIGLFGEEFKWTAGDGGFLRGAEVLEVGFKVVTQRNMEAAQWYTEKTQNCILYFSVPSVR